MEEDTSMDAPMIHDLVRRPVGSPSMIETGTPGRWWARSP